MQKVYYILLLGTYLLINISKCQESSTNEKPKSGNTEVVKKDLNRSLDFVNPWENYMKKYDIENNHNSGIKVDLGADVKLNNVDVRIPAGKCPVFGKGITIINSDVSFLKEVATGNEPLIKGGFAFPSTGEKKISPKTINEILTEYPNNVELNALNADSNKVSICQVYASSFKPETTDAKTEYRHPSVFDSSNDTCHMLYISAQENSGPRYCENKLDENSNRLFCFKPEKTEKFKDYVYLSKNVRTDWKKMCPEKNIEKAKFGLWVDGICEEIPVKINKTVNSLLECNDFIFQNSASDQPKQYEKEVEDYQKIKNAIVDKKPGDIHNVFFPPGAFRADKQKSEGKGYNWGNYDKTNKVCYAFNVKPTCLINDKDFIATTALSHPTETEDSFPCNIYDDEIKKMVEESKKKNSNGVATYPRIFISQNKNGVDCPCTPEVINKSSCTFYVCNCVVR
ncbi:apical membrane antigen 1, putative, partial [Hepatocystis sp. ex Piliocolobus tephrosceles]